MPQKQPVLLPKPRVFAYVRVSTVKQITESQEFGILKFADAKGWKIDEWVQEQASGTVRAKDRELGTLLDRIGEHDILIVGEVSRLGRKTLDILTTLNVLLQRKVKLFAVKEGYEFKEDLQSEVMAFAFAIAARIERDRISGRATENAAKRRAAGEHVGRPLGSQNVETKLTGKETDIKNLLDKGVAIAAIGRIYDVDRRTVSHFIKTRLR